MVLGEKQKAFNAYNQALQLQRDAGDRRGEGNTLSNLGLYFLSEGKAQKAIDTYNQAILLRRAVGDRAGEASTLSNIAYAERPLNRLNESLAHIAACLKIMESLRTSVVSRELRASYFAKAQSHYEFYIDLLMQLHKQQPTQKNNVAALQAVERSRARSLLESLTEARVDIRQGVDAALLERTFHAATAERESRSAIQITRRR